MVRLWSATVRTHDLRIVDNIVFNAVATLEPASMRIPREVARESAMMSPSIPI